MKKWIVYLLIAVVSMSMVVGCGNNLTEEQVRAKIQDYKNKEQWDEAIEMMEIFAKKFPEAEKAAENLYDLAGTYGGLRQFEKAVENYRKVIDGYPEDNLADKAQFMIGYVYANDLKDYEMAEKEYKLFLEKYPDHVLASSVEFELENLGKDITDIELQLGNQ